MSKLLRVGCLSLVAIAGWIGLESNSFAQCQKGGGGGRHQPQTGSSGMQTNSYGSNPYALAALQQQYALQQMQLNYMQQAIARQTAQQQYEYQQQLQEQRKLQAQREREKIAEKQAEKKAEKEALALNRKEKKGVSDSNTNPKSNSKLVSSEFR